MHLEFKLVELDAGVSEFALDIDGQLLRFRPGAKQSQSVQWPGPSNAGRVHLQVLPSAAAGYDFQGPWALFRLLDRVRVEPGSTPERSEERRVGEGWRAGWGRGPECGIE